jgi:predicted ester cyclase
MTLQEQNKAIVLRFNKEFIEKGDVQVFHEIIAPHFINHSAPPGTPKGPEGVLYFFNEVLRPAFPNLSVEIFDILAEDDKVVTYKTFHGTHEGNFMGVPPSHLKVEIDVIDIVRLSNGKVTEHWNVMDLESVLERLNMQEGVL